MAIVTPTEFHCSVEFIICLSVVVRTDVLIVDCVELSTVDVLLISAKDRMRINQTSQPQTHLVVVL